ncbi:hypothetical protein P691DRAFT_764431 [Macrolepiota fuliginosa MF-IS2]|uniref:RlpA-like protein double-psi beta-barrel domain-containing protein n=1 Tax=Macrolepiota fuliginosa MF-IS2 TaxID=1400762 RepID=A0A9P5X437_9AGAR|nr:hypothetical protein P691DRAFT_764431 [Macrolepiota fuliginosa MF-IS2]
MFFKQTSLFLLSAAIALVNAQTFTGQATWYFPGLGSCGLTNGNNDLIMALNAPQYNPSVCGRRARIFYQGKSVDVTVVDRCADCPFGNVDLSPAAFNQISNQDAGRIPVTWQYI